MSKTPLAVVILAAGKGTRMKSDKPKVMHDVLGLPMINWLLDTVETLKPEKIIVVVGPDMPELEHAASPHETVIQTERNGTGDALKTAMPALEGFKGDVLVLLGDAPLISKETLEKLIAARHDNAALSVLGTTLQDPSGYGRIIGGSYNVKAIREEKDASAQEKRITTVNAGSFCFNAERLPEWLSALHNDNAQGEYYLTDVPEIARKAGYTTNLYIAQNSCEVQGCNTRTDLAALECTAQKMLREKHLERGVLMQDPSSVYFQHDTEIAEGVTIEPSVYFGAKVRVEGGVHIKAFCHIEDTQIGENTTIGPFARLRGGSVLGEDIRIGNFVELKNAQLAGGVKATHLSYLGDAVIGKDTNIGAGTITCNYDGYEKHKTEIGAGVFIGSNTALVAPIHIDDGAVVGAGSTITTDVPSESLALERTEMEIREGWASQRRKDKA